MKCCGDRRIKFSVEVTMLNVMVSVTSYLCLVFKYSSYFDLFWFTPSFLFPIGAIMFGFCLFWVIKPKQQLRVYDPDQPDKIFIIKEGKVIDVTEEDTKNEAEKGKDTPEDGLSKVILRSLEISQIVLQPCGPNM